jgi:2-polyprenyl-3-methyl-5-hydroxy-6-metoxy-1,4-benzoquinol methylase
MSPRRKREWFDNEALWRDTYDFMFPPSRMDAAKDEVDKIIRLTRIKKGAALDLCCGPGRCSIALAKRKFTVTGVDRTKFLLNKARARARAARVKIEFIQKDMRDFVRPDSFDLVLSMYTSFGYFETKDEDLSVLLNIHKSLRRGGAFLIDTISKERIAKIFTPSSVDELPDGSLLVQRRKIVDDWTRTSNEWILVRKGRAKSFKFTHRLYSGQEIRDLMKRAGFKRVKLYGSFDGTPYNNTAERLIAVGRKG